MSDPDLMEIALGLTDRSRKTLRLFVGLGWTAAYDVGADSAPSVALYKRGLLARRSDPKVWGRAQYEITPLGRAVAALLTEAVR